MTLTLGEKIIAIYPELALGRKYWEGITIEDTGSGPKIATWSHSKYTQPTEAAIAAITQSDYDTAVGAYKWKRAAAYDSIKDQLDQLYWDKKNGTNKWVEAIDKVKSDYPKQ